MVAQATTASLPFFDPGEGATCPHAVKDRGPRCLCGLLPIFLRFAPCRTVTRNQSGRDQDENEFSSLRRGQRQTAIYFVAYLLGVFIARINLVFDKYKMRGRPHHDVGQPPFGTTKGR